MHLVPLFFFEKQGDSLAVAIKLNSKVVLPLIAVQISGRLNANNISSSPLEIYEENFRGSTPKGGGGEI